MNALPKIMVAPNGAHKAKSDHKNLPITIPELCKTATECFAVGADGIHIHIRDKRAKHSLDVGLYQEALTELSKVVPEMTLQITTESGGIFGPKIQRETALNCGASHVSIAVKEMQHEKSLATTQRFYIDCAAQNIAIQHIIYDPLDMVALKMFLTKSAFQDLKLQILFVLGRYTQAGAKGPEALRPYLQQLTELNLAPDWGVCAFGQQESNCLVDAAQKGGKLRVGFENSIINLDGSTANSNAERVAEVVSLTKNIFGNGTK